MGILLQDLKHALRMLRQNPAFTFAAIAALALGIGANTAIFSVVNQVLLTPLDVYEPDRIVQLRADSSQGVILGGSPAKFAHWKSNGDLVEMVTAHRTSFVNYTDGGELEQIRAAKVSEQYFRLFGAEVILGRTFAVGEDLPRGPRVAVLSHSFWVRRLNASPDILGRPIVFGGAAYTVVGVMEPGFSIRDVHPDADVWMPFQHDPSSTDQGHYFAITARLKPGVALGQVRARMPALTEAFRERFPDFNADQVFDLAPLRDALVANSRASLEVLMGAVGLVLLIACANVANLLLARAAGRRREIAIRSAMGAGRGRIVRQLLTESVLMATIAGAFGLLVGSAGIEALLSINAADLPRLGAGESFVHIDWRVVAFTFGASSLTGIVFGLIPAVRSSRADLGAALKEGGGRSGSGFRQNKIRSMLVISEMALALVLLVGATLLIRTSAALAKVDPGFDAANVLTVRVSLTDQKFATAEAVSRLIDNSVQRIEALPGIEVAATSCCVPLQVVPSLPFVIVGRPLDGPAHGLSGWFSLSPGFFEVFKIPVIRGRTFEARDTASSSPVVLINESMARQYWPSGDPLNDRLTIGRNVMREFADEPERQIVGIVGDVRDVGLNSDPEPRVYVPTSQISDGAIVLNSGVLPFAWVVRTTAPSALLSEQIQAELRQASGMPTTDVSSMEEIVETSLSRQKFNMWLMTMFGITALLLAAIGIYGLMAYSVQQRTPEIGIRLALGAQVEHVRNMVVRQGMLLAGVGVAIGLAAAYGLSQFIASFLFGVEPHDALTFVGVPLLLVLVALAATWIPARRASRVEPLKALRYELQSPVSAL